MNLAARLMEAAPWGDVWLDERVAQPARHIFDVALEGNLTLRGFSQQQGVYRLQGRREIARPLYQSALVGRQRELTRLRSFITPLFSGQPAGVMVISGEAGMGKTRLVDEFRTTVLPLNWLLCPTEQVLHQSLNPLRALLHRYFKQSNRQSSAANKQRFDRILNALIFATPDWALRKTLRRTRSFLGALVGLHWPESLYAQLDPKGRFENMLIAVKTLLQAESLRKPLVLYLEDVHWLDQDSIQFFRQLIGNLGHYPIAVIATVRTENKPVFFDKENPYEELVLKSLSASDLGQLAQGILGRPITPRLAEFLGARSEGNPFFAEHVLLDLRERDRLDYDRAEIDLLLGDSRVLLPTGVRAIITARLDRLPQDVKNVVQAAAVLGREFDVQLLGEILSQESDLKSKLDAAARLSIWAATDRVHYLFNHIMLRDVAYDMQLHARRRRLHWRTATALEKLYISDLLPYMGQVAYHYETAFQYGQPEARTKACYYLEEAGQFAADNYQNAAAVDYLTRAMSLVEQAEIDRRGSLLLAREKVYSLQGLREAQAQDLDMLKQLTVNTNGGQLRAEVALREAQYADAVSDFSLSVKAAETTVKLARASELHQLEALGYLQWGRALWPQGDYQLARARLSSAISLAQKEALKQIEADSLGNLGVVALYQSEYDDARRYYEKSLQIHQALRNRRGEGTMLNNLGIVAWSQGDYAAASGYYEQSLYIRREVGDRFGESGALTNLGVLLREQGDYVQSRSYLEQSLQICQEINDRWSEAITLSNLSFVANKQGESETAHAFSENALQVAEEIGDLSTQGYALMNMAHALIALGQRDTAFKTYNRALALRRELGQHNLAVESLAGLARVALGAGELTQALAYIDEILQYLEANTLDGTEEPIGVYLTCYRVLSASEDMRARVILKDGYMLLIKRAAKISDKQIRRSFLENVLAHWELTVAWKAIDRAT